MLYSVPQLVDPFEAEDTNTRALHILLKQTDTFQKNFDVSVQERWTVVSNIGQLLDYDKRDATVVRRQLY